jgi:hypothetical protein
MAISEATRRNIIRTLREEGVSWSGRLDDVDFLSRLYDLDQLPSHDDRFDNAKGDIWQHRINNYDWSDDWIFDDDRFDLLHCSDNEFLRFLCEMINPIVRPDRKEAENLLEFFNEQLGPEGYQIVEKKTRFGNVRYEPVGLLSKTISALEEVQDIAEEINSEYMQREILRMKTALEREDIELAIGTAKEFVETICKTILNERNKPTKGDENLPKLVYLTLEEVKAVPTVDTGIKTNKLVKKTLGTLSTLTQCIAELRNLYGTGHGKNASAVSLEPWHATLAVNAATTLALFFYQSHEKTIEKKANRVESEVG